MIPSFVAMALVLGFVDSKAEQLEALKALNDYIGDWNGTGEPPRARPGSKDFWTESVSWAWRFKGDDVRLVTKIKDGKYFKSGEMRYLPDKKKYQLTMTDVKDHKLVYEGELKDEIFTLECVDPDTKDTYRITMNLAGDGVRLIYAASKKPAGKTVYTKQYQVACNKVGESLGPKERKNLCIVTGGLGTSMVTYKGQTYYVCCSGCRDAFNENPEKYIKEAQAKNKK